MQESQGDKTVVFALNGERTEVKVTKHDFGLTLNDYLRRYSQFKGTKIGCGEGGCGACAVVIASSNSKKQIRYKTINSCLRPLVMVDGLAVTTADGLGNSQKGFHPVQKRLADWNGSQCGWCSPGMVMTTYGLLKEKRDRTMQEMEDGFDGNLCRCTGYRPILDSAKSFAKDATVKDDIGFKAEVGIYDEKLDPAFPEFLYNHPSNRSLKFVWADGHEWIRPNSLKDALALLNSTKDIKIVFANTGVGYYKRDRALKNLDLSAIEELQKIERTDNGTLIVGAGLPIVDFIDALQNERNNTSDNNTKQNLEALIAHATRIANRHVRNVGSLGGNLSMVQKFGFVSDLATLLLAANASVELLEYHASNGVVTKIHVPLDEFLADSQSLISTDNGVTTRRLLSTIIVPLKEKCGSQSRLRTYKVAPRPTMSIAFVNAGFNITLDESNNTVKDATIVFGGVDEGDDEEEEKKDSTASKKVGLPFSAAETAKFLIGKTLDGKLLTDLMNMLKKEVQIKGGHLKPYRQRLVCGLFYKYFVSLLSSTTTNNVNARVVSAVIDESKKGVTEASHAYKVDTEVHAPVSLPLPKISGILQTSGEAVYTDDIPDIKGTLFGAVVGARVGQGKFLKFDFSLAEKSKGFVGVVTAKDIVSPGKNNCSVMGVVNLVFLAEGEPVGFFGQALAMVVAETEIQAKRAAALVKTFYEDIIDETTKKPKQPILTIPQFLEAKQNNPTAGHISSSGNVFQKGDFDSLVKELEKGEDEKVKNLARAKGKVNVGSQSHFYMECQSAYVIPDEAGGYTIHNAMQWPDAVVSGAMSVLGVPANKLRVVMRRAGGAFGGKLTHNVQLACWAALAARKYRRPVKILLSRKADLRLVGGREETHAIYDVIFDKDTGRIQGLNCDAYLNSGYVINDLSIFTAFAFPAALSQAYHIPNIVSKCTSVTGNQAPRSVVRGPGEVNASFVIESIIAHVANRTGKSCEQVREVNFYDVKNLPKEQLVTPNGKPLEDYTIPELWARVKEKSNFDRTRKEVQEFNKNNRWKKRGCSMTTVRYEVSVWPKTAVVNIYGDGTVKVSHAGSEVGQGLETKVTQMVVYELNRIFAEQAVKIPDEDKLQVQDVHIGDTDSFVNPNALFTGGSTGSEGTGEAARRACAVLVGRLKPFIESLKRKQIQATPASADAAKVEKSKEEEEAEIQEKIKNMGFKWKDLCSLAKHSYEHLSASGSWSGSGDSALTYNNYGVAASLVEVDILTGEVNVMSTDIVYDCGKSLNPAIDFGQSEGAFMMGLGHFLREHVVQDENAILLSDNTFTYHIPSAKDVPSKLSVEFLCDAPYKKGILSSKASGEPPLVLATSVAMAIREAIDDARREAGLTSFYILDAPFTSDVILAACGTDESQFVVS